MTNRLFSRCSLLLALSASSLAAQTRPTIVLDKGALEYPEAFSKVTQLVELRDGRVLLLDNGESALLLVDLKRGTSSKVSRKGGGPLEYRTPGSLLGGAGDTILYHDLMQGRFLLLSQGAVPLSTSRFDTEDLLTRAVPTTSDARGRLYGQTMGFGEFNPNEKNAKMPAMADTVEIQQIDPKSGKGTMLTRIRNPVSQSKPNMEQTASGFKLTLTAGSFHPSDVWTVLPDGRLAVLRDGVYQVRFIGEGGKQTSGPVVPYTAIPVTTAEKKALVDSVRTAINKSLAASQKAMASMRMPDGKAMPKTEIDVLEPAKWAATKPAYTSMISSPDGLLWVSRSRVAGSPTAGYDVLSGSGALLAHVQLAAGESLVGVGRGAVYTIRMDEDDLQYLRRYTLPAMK